MITSGQIRAARALLDWSRAQLSEKSGVGVSALMRLESAESVPGGHVKTIESVRVTLEKAGIEFTGSPDSQAGVRWKK